MLLNMLNELKLTAKRLGYELRPLSETVKDTVSAVAGDVNTGSALAHHRHLKLTTALERLRAAARAGLIQALLPVGRGEIHYEVAVDGLEWLRGPQ